MDFASLNNIATSITIATMTTFGTIVPNHVTPSPSPTPLVKPNVQVEKIIIEPKVTVEKFIGPTLPVPKLEIEPVTNVISNESEKSVNSSPSAQNDKKSKQLESNTVSSPSPTTQPSTTPSPTPVTSKPTSQNFDLIWQMVNDHRAKIGLPPFEKDERLCKIAETRGPQLNNEVFGDGVIHQGMRDMNLPYWNTENVVAYETEQKNFDWWISDDIHRRAIESNNKYSCGTCFGNACVQEFSSFVPK